MKVFDLRLLQLAKVTHEYSFILEPIGHELRRPSKAAAMLGASYFARVVLRFFCIIK